MAYPKASLRIEFGPDQRIGPGKVHLLELVAQTGSISAAAREMDMSYRRAWLLIDEMNRMFKEPVIAAVTGGAHRPVDRGQPRLEYELGLPLPWGEVGRRRRTGEGLR